MKGVLKRKNEVVFRVCMDIYPEALVRRIFGEGEQAGNYWVYREKADPQSIYEKFNQLLEEMQ